MSVTVFYEFVFNTMDGDDIHENYPCADKWVANDEVVRVREIAKAENLKAEVELWRNAYSDELGLIERGFAQVGDANFCSGHKVPKQKQAQLMELHRRLHE